MKAQTSLRMIVLVAVMATTIGQARAEDIQLKFKEATFDMPFFVNQTWRASTYDGHDYLNSVDLIRFSANTNISEGAVVVASATGSVDDVGSVLSPGGDYYSDFVQIHHAVGDWRTRYLHIVRDPGIVKGAKVYKGQRLGTVGKYLEMTPHLHYTQLKSGTAMRIAFEGVPINVYAGAQNPDGSFPTQNLTSKNTPTSCAVTNTPNGGSVKCLFGAGVRAVVSCDGVLKGVPKTFVRKGPAVGARATSLAKGKGSEEVFTWSYETT